MRVNVLQALRKLVVQPVDKADNTAANANNSVLLRLWRALGHVIVVLGDLLHGVRRLRCNDGDELVDLLLRSGP